MRRVWLAIWPILKYLIPLVVIAGVGWYFAGILSRPELTDTPYALRFEWLIPAGLVYLLAHLVWASFWVDLLHANSVPAPWREGIRAYYVSQLGKYIPGKALVILLRVAMLHAHAPSKLSIGLAAAYETFTTMAAGALVGLLLLPWLGGQADLFQGREIYLILLVALPMGIGVLHKLLGSRKSTAEVDPLKPQARFRLLLLGRGFIQAMLGWTLMGLSFWMTVQGVRPEVTGFPTLTEMIRYTAMIALAYVIGFAALVVPGGVGVREWFVQTFLAIEFAVLLAPAEAEALAVVAALVLRLVWTVAEVFLILCLYTRRRYPRDPV